MWGATYSAVELQDSVNRMNTSMNLRGPDGEGVWLDEDTGIALGHRRLSIIDLTSLGHQPMISPSSRYVISFNGEIYNFRSLRDELLKIGGIFRGTSDTEVLVNGFDLWGIRKTISKCAGMFAIAVWDRATKELHLLRDRMGEKPLYFGHIAGGIKKTFVFASTIDAIKHHPLWENKIDVGSASKFFNLGFIPAPYTIYRNIWKLQPGHHITIADHRTLDPAASQPYWPLHEYASKRHQSLDQTQYEDYLSQLNEALTTSVREKMIADVPLGCFLSSGIDSSLMACLMQENSLRPIKTFTVGFDFLGDERSAAREVADRLKTDHTEIVLTADNVKDAIFRMDRIYDEPFADSSQIPSYLVCAAAKQHVTVCISGDGGDEFFAGYHRHIALNNAYMMLKGLPNSIRIALSKISLESGAILRRFSDKSLDPANSSFASRLLKLGRFSESMSGSKIYFDQHMHWTTPPLKPEFVNLSSLPALDVHLCHPLAETMYWDTKYYLPDDIMTKMDRASMAVSLETRAPLLDHRVAEIAMLLPIDRLINEKKAKAPLRTLLKSYLPNEMIDRPKRGFGVPIHEWLKGDLKEWASDLFSPASLKNSELLEEAAILPFWNQHLSGTHNHIDKLWPALMFLGWERNNLRQQIDKSM